MSLPLLNTIKSRWRRPWRYSQIFWLVIRMKPRKIMEIGTWTGDRALTMIKLAKGYRRQKEIDYYGFDLFEEMTQERYSEEISKWPPAQAEAQAKLSATGINIHLFQGDTMKTLPQEVPALPKMDLIFIDGGHSLETSANDWQWASRLMHEKTVVIFDDYWSDRTDAGCKVTVDSLDRTKYSVTLWPLVDKFKKTAFGPLKIKLAKVTKR
ncbi:MAG: class I SAM-dependent methyltransferase [bacterium]|nr:class I SAM-dependent methyltransferase [bacterium]